METEETLLPPPPKKTAQIGGDELLPPPPKKKPEETIPGVEPETEDEINERDAYTSLMESVLPKTPEEKPVKKEGAIPDEFMAEGQAKSSSTHVEKSRVDKEEMEKSAQARRNQLQSAKERIEAQLKLHSGGLESMSKDDIEKLKEQYQKTYSDVDKSIFGNAFDAAFGSVVDRQKQKVRQENYKNQVEGYAAKQTESNPLNAKKSDGQIQEEFDNSVIKKISETALTPTEKDLYSFIKKREQVAKSDLPIKDKREALKTLDDQIFHLRDTPDLYSYSTGELLGGDKMTDEQKAKDAQVNEKAQNYFKTYKGNLGHALVQSQLSLEQVERGLNEQSKYTVPGSAINTAPTYGQLAKAAGIGGADGSNSEVKHALELAKQRDDLYMEREALKKAYLLNKSSDHRNDDGFFNSVATTLVENLPGGKEFKSNTSDLNYAKQIWDASKVYELPTTKAMEEATEPTTREELGAGTGQIVKTLPKFIAAAALTDGVGEITGLGELVSPMLEESSPFLDKVIGHTIKSMEEGIKFQVSGAGDVEGGIGFYAGATTFGKFDLPFKPTGFWGSAMKTLANYGIKQGIGGGAAGMTGAGVAESLVQSLTTDKDFQNAIDEHFGDTLDKKGKAVLANLATGLIIGFPSLGGEWLDVRKKALETASGLKENGMASDAKNIMQTIGKADELIKKPKVENPVEEKTVEKPAASKEPEVKPEEVNKHVAEKYKAELTDIDKRNQAGEITDEQAKEELNKLKERAAKELAEKPAEVKKESEADLKKQWEELQKMPRAKGKKARAAFLKEHPEFEKPETEPVAETPVKEEKPTDNNENIALNLEFLNKGIGNVIYKEADGYYYTKNGIKTKIPNQERAEKAFIESKKSEAEIISQKTETKPVEETEKKGEKKTPENDTNIGKTVTFEHAGTSGQVGKITDVDKDGNYKIQDKRGINYTIKPENAQIVPENEVGVKNAEDTLKNIPPGTLMLADNLGRAVEAITTIANDLINKGAATIHTVWEKVKEYLKGLLPGIKDPQLEKMKEAVMAGVKEEPVSITQMLLAGKTDEEIKAERAKREATLIRVKEIIEKQKSEKALSKAIKPEEIKGFLKTIASKILGEHTDTGDEAKAIIRARNGNKNEALEIITHANDKLRDFWNNIPSAYRKAFILSMENPKKYGEVDPAFKNVVYAYRERLDNAFKMIEAIKDVPYLEDYFPHFWKDPEKAKSVIAGIHGKKPLEGNKSFLKKRFYADILAGMEAGLELATDNPEEMVQLAETNAWRFKTAWDMFHDFQEKGLLKYFKAGEAEEGWKPVDDPIFKRLGLFVTKEGTGQLDIHGNEQTKYEAHMAVGGYYMPEEAARIVNNYLSPGFSGPLSKLARTVRGYNNLKNLFQLGVGVFHFTTTSIDATVTGGAIALQELSALKFAKGTKDLVKALAVVPNLIETLKVGDKAITGRRTGNFGDDTENLAKVNGNTGLSKIYTFDSYYNAKKAWANVRVDHDFSQIPKLAWNLLTVAPELVSKPLMEWYVPRLKVGGFLRTWETELALNPDMTEAQKDKARLQAWDNMDNRLGQVVYDNIFWDKTIKDLAFMAIRSQGWTIGTIKALGGGALDIPESIKKASQGKGISQRTAWAIMLPIQVGLMGGLYQWAMSGKKPDELMDYFFPLDGTKNADGTPHRVSLPSYMKDVFAYQHDWLQTIGHKTSPGINEVIEVLSNKDFYGVKIFNKDDSTFQKGIDLLNYELQSFVPFSWKQKNGEDKSALEQISSRQGLEQKFGLMPAMKEFGRSKLENDIVDLTNENFGERRLSKEEAVQKAARSQIRQALHKGTMWGDIPKKLKDDAKIDPDRLDSFIESSKMNPYERMFKYLHNDQKEKLFKSMSKEEKAKYLQYMPEASGGGKSEDLSPEEIKEQKEEKSESKKDSK